MNVIVFLENNVDAFRVTDSQLNSVSSRFPEWCFTRALNEQSFLEMLPDADLVVTWEFKVDWYKIATKLKAVCTPSAGHDWIARLDNYPIPIFHGSFHGPIMAESLLAMILYFNRNFPQILSNQEKHIWDRDTLSHTHRLGSQHIIIVGYGNIARECSRILKTFGCRITGIKHSPYNPWLDKYADTICHPDHLKSILSDCDHLVSILPGSESNNLFFNRELLTKLKPGAYFYSIGRGNSFSEEDIIWALHNHLLAGAGLDVFPQEPLSQDSNLWNHPNVLIMPHGTAIVEEYLSMYFDELVEVLKTFKKI